MLERWLDESLEDGPWIALCKLEMEMKTGEDTSANLDFEQFIAEDNEN